MINRKKVNIEKDFGVVSFSGNSKTKKSAGVVIPNVHQLAREMTSKSQVGIIIERVLKLSPTAWVSLGLNNILSAPLLLKKDFATGIKILCELEILKERDSHYILHNQFVDMAVATNNKRVLYNFLSLARKYNFKPGIITYNVGPFIKYLSGVRKPHKKLVIYTPLDPKQYPINPGYEDVIEYIKSSELDFRSI